VTATEVEQDERTAFEKYGEPAGAPYGLCTECYQPVWGGYVASGHLYCHTHKEAAERSDFRRRDRGIRHIGSPPVHGTVPQRLAYASRHFSRLFQEAALCGTADEAEYWAYCMEKLWDSSSYYRRAPTAWRQVIREIRMPEIDYRVYILEQLEKRREAGKKYTTNPTGHDDLYRGLIDDHRFDRDAFNAAMTDLQAAGKIVYYRQLWWHPEEKQRYQQIHNRGRGATTVRPKRINGLA
jgi:hypothetical protein